MLKTILFQDMPDKCPTEREKELWCEQAMKSAPTMESLDIIQRMHN